MYPNYIKDRKSLGYKCLLDTECGNGLVLITDSTVVFVKNVASNAKGKSQKLLVVVTLAGVVWFSNLESAEAISCLMVMRPIPLVTVQPNSKHRDEMKVAPRVSPKLDKITFIKYRELPVCIYMTNERFLRNAEVSKLIKKIHGGSLIEAAAALVVIIFLYQILGVGGGFVPNNPSPGWGLNRPNPFQPPTADHRYPTAYDLFFPRKTPGCPRPGSTLEITRPSSMPHQEFVGLSKEERRGLPHSNDMTIIHKGRPKLEVGFWQSKFKVGDHGAIHNLPPQQRAVNTFESDVMGITPISPMDKNSSPGFTPRSSFESDIMGITFIDNSQLDNP